MATKSEAWCPEIGNRMPKIVACIKNHTNFYTMYLLHYYPEFILAFKQNQSLSCSVVYILHIIIASYAGIIRIICIELMQ